MDTSKNTMIVDYIEQVREIYRSEYQNRSIAIRNKRKIDSEEQASEKIRGINNSLCLHICADNFDYFEHCNTGIAIPRAIVENVHCDLGTALMVFYKMPGINFLYRKGDKPISDMAKLLDKIAAKMSVGKYEYNKDAFLEKLYNDILTGYYKKREISYTPTIGYVERDTLKRRNPNVPSVFLEKTKGEVYKFSKIWYKK